MKSDELGIILYTDGACRPQPGYTGWGVHGYLYALEELTKPATIDNHIITNYGYLSTTLIKAKESNPDIQSVQPIEYYDFFGSALEIGTNNQAEINALLNSLEFLVDKPVKTISVFTDSEYVLNGITKWCLSWEKSNWVKQDGTVITNSDLWKRLHQVVKTLKASGITFNIQWVKAHAGIFGNEHADILAVIGMSHSTDGIATTKYRVTEAKGYWKEEIERHPFLNFKRIYFNSMDKFNIIGHYFLADPGGGDFIIGKRIPETGFAVIKLKEPDEIIEAIKVKQYEAANEQNVISMIKLDRVYSKGIYPYLRDYGKYCLLTNKANLNLNFIDNKPIVVEINPTGLSLRAVESFNFLEELLGLFLNYRESGFKNPDNNIRLNSHDITFVFYDIQEKLVKKENKTVCTLKPEFNNGFKDIKLTIDVDINGKPTKVVIPLILGLDILPRNNLKKLEVNNPKVHLITWCESESTLRYATIIEYEGGIGIWSNFFADRIFLKP